jgi:acyl-CoA thioesterase
MKKNPFWEYIHLEVLSASNGTAQVKCNVFESILNSSGSVHGGVLATLVDTSIGNAVLSKLDSNQSTVTVDLNIKYIKPARGTTILAKASLSNKGGKLAVGTCEIFDDNNNLVAIGNATFMILNKKE